MDERVARTVLVAYILAADGMIRPVERRLLDQLMDQLALTQAERELVAESVEPEEAMAIVAQLPEAERRAILDEVLAAALVDSQLSPLELAAVDTLTKGIGLGARDE